MNDMYESLRNYLVKHALEQKHLAAKFFSTHSFKIFSHFLGFFNSILLKYFLTF